MSHNPFEVFEAAIVSNPTSNSAHQQQSQFSAPQYQQRNSLPNQQEQQQYQQYYDQ